MNLAEKKSCVVCGNPTDGRVNKHPVCFDCYMSGRLFSSELSGALNSASKSIKWLPESVNYLAITGSRLYGAATEDSDYDMFGWCFAPVDQVFPKTGDFIPGFDAPFKPFSQMVSTANFGLVGTEFDFTIYGLTKFFKLLSQSNPNVLPSLYVPRKSVKIMTPVAKRIRDNRSVFLSREMVDMFRGFYGAIRAEVSKETYAGKKVAAVFQMAISAWRVIEDPYSDLEYSNEDTSTLMSIREEELSPEDILEAIRKYAERAEEDMNASAAGEILSHNSDLFKRRVRAMLRSILQEKYGRSS